jgi:hypothetical protein
MSEAAVAGGTGAVRHTKRDKLPAECVTHLLLPNAGDLEPRAPYGSSDRAVGGQT